MIHCTLHSKSIQSESARMYEAHSLIWKWKSDIESKVYTLWFFAL